MGKCKLKPGGNTSTLTRIADWTGRAVGLGRCSGPLRVSNKVRGVSDVPHKLTVLFVTVKERATAHQKANGCIHSSATVDGTFHSCGKMPAGCAPP